MRIKTIVFHYILSHSVLLHKIDSVKFIALNTMESKLLKFKSKHFSREVNLGLWKCN